MGRTGHRLTGLAAGIAVAALFWPQAETSGLAAILGGHWGGTAPDWMEIAHTEKRDGRWQRVSVIPHRTWTHWWLLWAILTIVLVFFPIGDRLSLADMFAIGFLAGAWTHLVMDATNPMGIPLLTPYRRWGLGLWRSGHSAEPMVGTSILMVALLGLWVSASTTIPLLHQALVFTKDLIDSLVRVIFYT